MGDPIRTGMACVSMATRGKLRLHRTKSKVGGCSCVCQFDGPLRSLSARASRHLTDSFSLSLFLSSLVTEETVQIGHTHQAPRTKDQASKQPLIL